MSIGRIGAVFLAHQERPHRYVAVKVIHRELARDPETWQLFLARFQREADATANLEHANIVPIHEFGETGDLAYLVMPYFTEGSLATRLEQQGPLSLPDTVQFVEQVAAALDYAHAHGIIHRDVKPSNMLVHPDGRVMLADFGIARPLHLPDQTTQLAPELGEEKQSTASLTQAGTALGTPDYMAPEQVQLETLSPATDVYALGIATYELLGGKTPFEGGDVSTVLQSHVTLPPPPLRALRPELPTRVEEVIFWALAKDPADRPATAGQFAKALRATLSTEPPDSGNGWSLHSAPSLGLIAAVEGQENGGHQRVLSEDTLPLHRSAALFSATTLPPVTGAGGHRRVRLLPLSAKLQQPRALVAAALALALTVAALGTSLLVLRAASAGKPSASGRGLPAAVTMATATAATVPAATPAAPQATTAPQATATATTVQPTAAPPPTATVPMPSPSPTPSPRLMIHPTPLVLQPSPQNPKTCVATQTITNTTGQTVGWQWQQPQQGGFHFQINRGPMMDWPKDLQPGIPPGGTDTLTATSDCQPQPKVFGILLTDTLGDQYTFVLQLQ